MEKINGETRDREKVTCGQKKLKKLQYSRGSDLP
jgi:hypothetical protein